MQAEAVRASPRKKFLGICEAPLCSRRVFGRSGQKYCKQYCVNQARNARLVHARFLSSDETRQCALPGCENAWRIVEFRGDKVYCSGSRESDGGCAGIAYRARTRDKKVRDHAARKVATTGRKCAYCEDEDKDVPFQSAHICSRCAKQLSRSKCERCGGPFYVTQIFNKHRHSGCVVAYRLPPGFDCKEEVSREYTRQEHGEGGGHRRIKQGDV